jgi:hypothetical protein
VGRCRCTGNYCPDVKSFSHDVGMPHSLLAALLHPASPCTHPAAAMVAHHLVPAGSKQAAGQLGRHCLPSSMSITQIHTADRFVTISTMMRHMSSLLNT